MKHLRILTSVSFFAILLHAPSAWAQNFINEVPDGTENHSVSPELLKTISDALPEERSQIDQNFLNRAYDPNIRLSLNSQLSVTFIDEGAGYKNSLGYFTFNDDTFSGLTFGDIDTDNSSRISTNELAAIEGVNTKMVFPNTSLNGSGGRLDLGDTYVLGGGSIEFTEDSWVINDGDIFDAGTNVGFFLAANAWNDYGSANGVDIGTVDGWDSTSGDPNVYYTLDFLNPENSATASFDSDEYMTRHVALTFESEDRNTLIMGFEDLYNLGDADFNDTVFLVRSDPTGAMATTNVEVYSAPAPIAGGGIIGAFMLMAIGWLRKTGLPLAT